MGAAAIRAPGAVVDPEDDDRSLEDALPVRGDVEDNQAAGQAGAVYRLVATLRQAHLVEPGGRRGRVRLGLKMLRLGAAVAAGCDERRVGLPVMKDIHDRTGEKVFLAVRRSRQAVCVERLDGKRVWNACAGARWGLTAPRRRRLARCWPSSPRRRGSITSARARSRRWPR
jgi:hypothetical protein